MRTREQGDLKKIEYTEELFFNVFHQLTPFISLLQVGNFIWKHPQDKGEKITHGQLFHFPPLVRTYNNFSPSRIALPMFPLIELDVVGREKAGLAAKVAEPPVVVGEFLQKRVSTGTKVD